MSQLITSAASMSDIAPPSGTDQLLKDVRAAFTRQGSSLNAWCHQHGVQRSYAHRALVGATNGPAARELRKRLVEAARTIAA